MPQRYSREFKLGLGVALLAIVSGFLPVIFSMTPFLLWTLRSLCAVAALGAVALFADVVGHLKSAVKVLVVVAALTAIAYSSYRLGQRSEYSVASVQQPHPQPSFRDLGHLFLSYGADGEHICHAVLDGSLLVQWSDNFRLVLVCGIVDPSIDQYSNRHITVSSSFTIIHPTAIDISARHKPGTEKEIQRIINAQLVAIPKQARKSVGVEWTLWYNPVLLPPKVNPEDIQQLGNVAKLGGIIVPEGRILTTISKH
jgi:hypothetical protein